MKIGEAIKKLRLDQGATQEDVAWRAGTNAGNLSRIERCQQKPALELVEKIAAALNVTVTDLYDNVSISQPKNKTKSNNELILFQRLFKQLNPENKKLVTEFVKLLNRFQKNS